MPSTITHEYFYRDVYSKTDDSFRKNYPLETYRDFSVGAQGHDALFFYSFWNLPNFMKRRDIVLYIENNRFQELCAQYISSIINFKQKESKEVKLILYGYILHHILDSYEHPFIIYETEREKLHERVESYIDKWMIERKTNSDSSRYPVHEIVAKMPEVKRETKTVISDAFYKTYNLENFGEMYINALKQVRLFLRLFRYDSTGIKKLGYNIIDSTKLFNLTFSWLSYKTKYEDFEKFLNENHQEWGNPINKDIVSQQSFLELYEIALNEGAKIISELERAIMDNASKTEIMDIVPDRSAVHGLECGKSLVYTNLK